MTSARPGVTPGAFEILNFWFGPRPYTFAQVQQHSRLWFGEANAPKAMPGQNTVMPWIAFSGMTEQDLGAIFDYLKSLKPIRHDVNPFPDAPRS